MICRFCFDMHGTHNDTAFYSGGVSHDVHCTVGRRTTWRKGKARKTLHCNACGHGWPESDFDVELNRGGAV